MSVSTPKPGSAAPDQLIEDLVLLRRTLRKISHPARSGEVTPQQFWLLRQLWREGPQGVSELASAVGVSPSSTTTACQRLERAGLVTRQRQPSDERVVLVALTERGNDEVELWNRRRREAMAKLLAPLDEQERARLQHLVEHMLSGANRSPAESQS